MTGYAEGFILGFIQGLTEFLPVSSSGHLVLAENLGVGEENVFFNLALHLATLLAVTVAFRKKIFSLLRHPLQADNLFILVASVPTAVLAGVIRYFFPSQTEWLPFCFAITGFVLLLPETVKPLSPPKDNKGLVLRALFCGLCQGAACINGISRSGTTVSAMRLAGFGKEECAEKSFLLSIPIIVGSSAVELLTGGAASVAAGPLVLGAITAFAVGLCAIFLFIKILKKGKLWIFSLYTFLMAIVTFLIL